MKLRLSMLQSRIERLLIIALIFVGISIVIISIRSVDTTLNSSIRSSWMQSTERSLMETNERYYNEVYDRYSRMSRDLTNYQRVTNKRIDTLSRRIEELKKEVAMIEDYVEQVKEGVVEGAL